MPSLPSHSASSDRTLSRHLTFPRRACGCYPVENARGVGAVDPSPRELFQVFARVGLHAASAPDTVRGLGGILYGPDLVRFALSGPLQAERSWFFFYPTRS